MSALAHIRQGPRDGTTVLLLHGIGGGKSIWGDGASGTVQALALAGFDAAALDLPGYGESPMPAALTLATMVDAVEAFIHTLGARQTVLVGHSMGGMLAQELVRRAPVLVQGLVLACTSASFGKADGAWQAAFLKSRLAPLDAGLGMAGMAASLVPGLMSPAASVHAGAVAKALMAALPEATYRAALHAIAGFDRRESLALIKVPTLCLAAEHDTTAAPDVMQRMAARIPSAHYVCLRGAGHIANLEQPQAFNAALLDFLGVMNFSPSLAGSGRKTRPPV